MTKIMLVEDDNNLREIYESRLLMEGYEIVSAKDGEEALALAVKEKPDLIISDVMMPKISGFDMLDILRSTPETKNTKVIMMTALSQTEDKTRADKLGADRYLVKSQVTLEDVAKVAHEVLNGEDSPTDAAALASMTGATIETPATSVPFVPESAAPVVSDSAPLPEPQLTPAPEPAMPTMSAPDPTPQSEAAAPAQAAPLPEPVATPAPAAPESAAPVVPDSAPLPEPVAPVSPEPTVVEPAAESLGAKANELAETVNKIVEASDTQPQATEAPTSNNVNGKKVIAPISAPAESPNLDSLLAAEEQKANEALAERGIVAPPVVVADASAPTAPVETIPVASAPDAATPPPPPGNIIDPKDPANIAL